MIENARATRVIKSVESMMMRLILVPTEILPFNLLVADAISCGDMGFCLQEESLTSSFTFEGVNFIIIIDMATDMALSMTSVM